MAKMLRRMWFAMALSAMVSGSILLLALPVAPPPLPTPKTVTTEVSFMPEPLTSLGYQSMPRRTGQQDHAVEADAFDRAFDRLQRFEGGDAWSDDPDDPGGQTRWGISSKAHPDIDLELLNEGQARHFFFREYWQLYNVWRRTRRNADMAALYFGATVNVGPAKATMIFQRALNAVTSSRYVKDDGTWGHTTSYLTRLVLEQDDLMARMLAAAFRSELAGYYRWLAQRNTKLARFERGWLTRAYEL